MQKHPMIEQLIDAHLDFLEQEFSNPITIENEFLNFYCWFKKQSLENIWSFEQINALLQKQLLDSPLGSHLIEQIIQHFRFFLIHPLNENTQISDVIPVVTIDKIAQYVASKAGHRQRLIQTVVNSPAFSAMIGQIIQHSIQDYLDHSVMAKRVPGMSSFMKMGKSVLETVTDSNLEQTIGHYLQKNIFKLSQMSEHVLNQHFDDEKLYHFQANIWHKIKDMPLTVLKNYIEIQDLPETVGLAHDIWDHLRQTAYLKQQLHDGIYTWYVSHQQQSLDSILQDLNIDESLIQNQLQALLHPLFQRLISSEYLRQRARIHLEKFYYSETAQGILKL